MPGPFGLSLEILTTTPQSVPRIAVSANILIVYDSAAVPNPDRQTLRWLKDIPDARLFRFRYQGYSLGTVRELQQLGGYLLQAFDHLHQIFFERACPVVIVTHGSGGLLVRQALVSAAGSAQHRFVIEGFIRGILFLDAWPEGLDNPVQIPYKHKARLGLFDQLLHDARLNLNLQVVGQKFDILKQRSRLPVVSFVSPSLGIQLLPSSRSRICTTSTIIPTRNILSHLKQGDLEVALPEGFEFRGETSSHRIILAYLKAFTSQGLLAEEPRTSLSSIQEYLQSLQIDKGDAQIHRPSVGTLSWILVHQAYLTWLHSDTATNLFWIKGKAGCGKSTLMKSLAERDQNESYHDVSLAFFFSRSPHTKQQNQGLSGLLRALLYQLLNKTLHISSSSRRLAAFLSETDQDVSHSWTNKADLLTEHLQLLLVQAPVEREFVLFIDGLDECDGSDADEIMVYIRRLSNRSWARHLKICLSSRRAPGLEKYSQKGDISLYLDQENHDDIARFVRDKLVEFGSRKTHTQTQTRMQYVLETITRKANGVFLWVVLVLRELQNSSANNEHDMFLLLSNLPSDLQGLYRILLDRIAQENKSTIKSMSWILSAMRPLTALELFELSYKLPTLYERKSSFEMTDVRQRDSLANTFMTDLRYDSYGLLDFYTTDDTELIPPSSDPRRAFVNFIHRTVDEFLRSSIHEYLPSGWTLLEREILLTRKASALLQGEIAAYTLNYLDLAARISDDRKLSIEQTRMMMPLLDYACMFSIKHLIVLDDVLEGLSWKWAVFEYHKNQYVGSWIAFQHLFPDGTPKWLLEKPDLLAIGSHYGLASLLTHLLKAGYDRGPGLHLDIDGYNVTGMTTLHIAATAGHDKTVKTLLHAGANLNTLDRTYGQSALKSAAWAGRKRVVELLLSLGSNVDDFSNGSTALSQSCANGHLEVAKTLLDYGADPNIMDLQRGQTPLTLAVTNGYIEVVRTLLDHGADINVRDLQMKLPALYHAVHARNPGMVELLLERGADAEEIMDEGPCLPEAHEQWIFRILRTLSSYGHHQSGGGSQQFPQQRQEQCSRAASNDKNLSSKNAKRRWAQQTPHDDEQGDEERPQKQPRKPKKPAATPRGALETKFVCPYVKFDPLRFGDVKSCAHTPYTVDRLKDHLKKHHFISRCELCGQGDLNSNSALHIHQISGQCHRVQLPEPNLADGFYKSKALVIEDRWRNVDPVTKWQRIYRVLFDLADAEPTPSPYFEPAGLVEYRANRAIEVLREALTIMHGSEGASQQIQDFETRIHREFFQESTSEREPSQGGQPTHEPPLRSTNDMVSQAAHPFTPLPAFDRAAIGEPDFDRGYADSGFVSQSQISHNQDQGPVNRVPGERQSSHIGVVESGYYEENTADFVTATDSFGDLFSGIWNEIELHVDHAPPLSAEASDLVVDKDHENVPAEPSSRDIGGE